MLLLRAAFWIYATLSAALAIYAAHRLWLVALAWRAGRRAHATPGLPTELPVVTVQLPLYNERFVAARLIDAACALDWPRDRLEVQILDDSSDDTGQICAERALVWRARGVDVVHLRRPDRTGFKAGALEHGLARARGELVLVLDADFVPAPDLLRRTAGHFADPRVGMVQARWEHLNRAAGPLTQVQALLLDGHFAVEQPARAASGRFFNFNGTAGLWRKRAIAAAGGWQHDTLTEDLDLSYRALLGGWRFVYLREQSVPGELPADINGFKSQQFRWAKGSVQVARKLLPALLRARLPLRVKLEAVLHLTHNVPYLLTALLALVAVPALVWADSTAALPLAFEIALAVGASVITGVYLVAAERAIGRRPLAALLRLPALLAVTAGISLSQSRAVLEGAAGRPSEFVRTPKTGDTDTCRKQRRAYRASAGLMPALELAAAVYLGLGFCQAVASGRLAAAPILALFAIGFAAVGAASCLSALR
jgi:cellulose synthase/poly-beta-1,6-N-acetylglucosamine synthase-like glycosyltransferase